MKIEPQPTPDLPAPIRERYPYKSNFLQLRPPASDSEEGRAGPSSAEDVFYHYLDEGKGEAVIMVHGNPTWSFFYRDLIGDFKGDFRCIAPDHIGCGLSSKPRNYPYRLSSHIENLERLIDDLRLESYHLILHDWGGPIGIAVAQNAPEKVKQMVILNTAAFLPQNLPFALNICRIPVIGSILVRGCNAFAGLASRFAARKKLPKQVRAGYLYPYGSWTNRVGTLRFVEDIPTSPNHPSFSQLERIEDRLPILNEKRILICWGMKDFVFTEKILNDWERRLPNAEIHRFNDAGHYVLEDAGAEIAPILRTFLSGISGTP